MQAWDQFLQQQEIELGKETVQKWLRSLKVCRFDACNLYLEAKDSFQALWFEEHVRSKAQQRLLNGNSKKIKIHLTIANALPEPAKKAKGKPLKKELETSSFQLVFDELDPFCHLENFIVADDNNLTYQLLAEIAGLPTAKPTGAHLGMFNPIYLHGSSGSGKTHLLMSLANMFKSKGLKALYVRAETFTDHVVSAIRAGEMSLFRQTYRKADILLVDDVHVFSRKGATQEEFFHTFNTLHLDGKQIILSANCAPAELQLIEPRLVSRFEWGMVLPLAALKVEDMQKLLKLKMQVLQFPLPDKIIEFLLQTFKSNSKALIKALEALVLRLHLDARHPITTLTVTAVKTLLSDLLTEEQKLALSPQKIIEAVADQYDIPAEEILGKSQSRECVTPRQMAMHLCRKQLKLPFMKIGDIFGRDHSTVMSSIKRIQKSLDENDLEVAQSWHAIVKKIHP